MQGNNKCITWHIQRAKVWRGSGYWGLNFHPSLGHTPILYVLLLHSSPIQLHKKVGKKVHTSETISPNLSQLKVFSVKLVHLSHTRSEHGWKTVMEEVSGFLIHGSINWTVSCKLLHQSLNLWKEFFPPWVILCYIHNLIWKIENPPMMLTGSKWLVTSSEFCTPM